MNKRIYEDNIIYIEIEKSEIPWLKIFPKSDVKELSQCDSKTRKRLFEVILLIEAQMLKYYNPKKINIASFGNYHPHLHIHIMARFEEDSFFPEPMWGKKQREATLNLPDFKQFQLLLLKQLEQFT